MSMFKSNVSGAHVVVSAEALTAFEVYKHSQFLPPASFLPLSQR